MIHPARAHRARAGRPGYRQTRRAGRPGRVRVHPAGNRPIGPERPYRELGREPAGNRPGPARPGPARPGPARPGPAGLAGLAGWLAGLGPARARENAPGRPAGPSRCVCTRVVARQRAARLRRAARWPRWIWMEARPGRGSLPRHPAGRAPARAAHPSPGAA